ncbi:hypothetical protein PIB30_054429 [Stylosanthes scabra]|uniref:Uncharacterized protein n=1 Tax=Stylosanthes scabra TaxID=79078 RepID=A0ABU6ZHK5_9FABA|nr:hypothetical protein [Stylosanthes scabra]
MDRSKLSEVITDGVSTGPKVQCLILGYCRGKVGDSPKQARSIPILARESNPREMVK